MQRGENVGIGSSCEASLWGMVTMNAEQGRPKCLLEQISVACHGGDATAAMSSKHKHSHKCEHKQAPSLRA